MDQRSDFVNTCCFLVVLSQSLTTSVGSVCLCFQVTDMMVANSHNLIVTVKPANQRNNVMHRGSKSSAGNSGSVGSAGSTGSAPSRDSPSPASQSNPITARYGAGKICLDSITITQGMIR